jgi:uncharacterized protein (TIGR00369 family)
MAHSVEPGERFADDRDWETAEGERHIWRTLGYRRLNWAPGATTIEWDAPLDYCFPTSDGAVVQGGLITALLDAAMGGACWTVLDRDEAFLTADLHVEFLRTARPGVLRASGSVVRRTRRVVFCDAQAHDDAGQLMAASRCTQIVLPQRGPFGRRERPADGTAPPEDARG